MSSYRFTTHVGYPDVEHTFCLSLTGALRMMQEAAAIHSYHLGYSFHTVQQTRVHWVLVGWQVEMVGKAHWNETVHVDTWPRTMERVTSRREFEIRNEKEELVCRASSNWILVSIDTGRAARITPEIAAAYPLENRDAFEKELVVPKVDEGVETWDFIVQRRDLDTNRHVNNLIYLDYARQALPEAIWQQQFPMMTVRYSRELLLGEHIRCIYRKGEGMHTVELVDDNKVLRASVSFFEHGME